MKKAVFIILFCSVASVSLMSQNKKDRVYILKHTNVKQLDSLAVRFLKAYETMEKSSKIFKGQITDKWGRVNYLSGFDKVGNPVYDHDDNIDAARTIRTDKIWKGGLSGLNLDGSGIVIGHWEASGLALATHQELKGRVTHAELADESSHATHTACTMIGTGINKRARGMASGATLVERKSDHDESELANFAAEGGILSNHSYSTGDPKGDTPEYGVYTDNSAEWDEIMYNAPYLLICKSAGNTRNDGVNIDDGGYDLVFTVATCKNLLTIGAVDDIFTYIDASSVYQTDFSSWGPTDDWRIKPDLVANGEGLFSADDKSYNSYTIKSGTSQSTASVTGTIALLQQHYHNINSLYMRSATVKALLICTANEAGDFDGPDFQNGWGLVNAERAAQVISNNGNTSLIRELSLNEKGDYTTEITTDGGMLTATIAWTDPPGNPVLGTDNQTPMLVNDLDMRLMGHGIIYKPWVLTPNTTSNNFTDAAQKGDNFRDNVERIDVKDIPSGSYTITVSHKDSLLHGHQDFSLVINGISEGSLAVANVRDKCNKISLYPNPVINSILHLDLPSNTGHKPYRLLVIDAAGRILKSQEIMEGTTQINVSQFSKGLYFLKILGPTGIYYRKIIKL